MTYISDSGWQRTSRTDLINELQRLNDTLDHTPTFQDMDEHGNYSGACMQSDSIPGTTLSKQPGLNLA